MTGFTVTELRIGPVRPFGPAASAIDKAPVAGALMAGREGLSGDEQADRRHHGGPDKALHAYALAHYPLWSAEMPERAALFRPGGFGENLVVEGADEDSICLGDRFRLGGALVEVSQGRQPCWKLNLRFNRPDMARLVQETGRSGWYFRVPGPGPVAAGDRAVLLARPNPGWTLARVGRLLYRDRLNRQDLREFAALPGLPESWRRLALARLESGRTEDWSRRIETPPGV
ncbi:MOSC domain-containing protein [Pseudogemmobacter humi]|uniref:6-N-hydroxylaminopurine resistance protein n=1 Tax=Pseudogemmobacter humi TaxID=2483812 RepID=A0A3P5X5T3_9RHOB|nr:MOSC domain-containing protein [Pseudogemmobacter humi]VDC26670.1 6-N-hydroxylaminopurine resistance protein [Pseudogemmobacter humi]